FEEELRKDDEEKNVSTARVPHGAPPMPDVNGVARITKRDGTTETPLTFKPGGRRLNVGRVADNDLFFNDTSVSKIHATLMMNQEGTLMVADTGSTNGTFINGRRMSYGEARQIEDGDVVSFGDVEVRFRKND
ncbi:MAG: FHA domain-containing protein, partial [Pyrinomonadaceae bacterium]